MVLCRRCVGLGTEKCPSYQQGYDLNQILVVIMHGLSPVFNILSFILYLAVAYQRSRPPALLGACGIITQNLHTPITFRVVYIIRIS